MSGLHMFDLDNIDLYPEQADGLGWIYVWLHYWLYTEFHNIGLIQHKLERKLYEDDENDFEDCSDYDI